MDQRLGPRTLPSTGTPGSAYMRIAQMTKGYRRLGFSHKRKLKLSAFLAKYWHGDEPSGRWIYPPLGGFAIDPMTDQAEIHVVTLEPGELVDRFGSPLGIYLSPAGTPYSKRALPPQSLDYLPGTPMGYGYHVYKVLKAFTVEDGPIAPWFGQRGGGVQYLTCGAGMPEPWTCKDPNVEERVDKFFLQEEPLPLK